MRRRTFLAGALSSAAAGLVPSMARAAPSEADWDALAARLPGRLIDVRSPLVECARSGGRGADALMARMRNPYWLGDEPSLTQTLGWVDAWVTQPSIKAVAATSAADVAEAVRFARRTGIPLVVKGGGHSYFGNSNRAGSLLLWTRRLRDIRLHDSFSGVGWPEVAEPVPAVSVGAGCLWGEVYRKVSVEGGRYAQGGGCLTVGVAGFTLGGGFGSFSKRFGTGASNLLEAEIVTADGSVRIANAHQHPDLYFALRGGGGGTFGIVTRLTMRTHPLPDRFGVVLFEATASSNEAWRALVERMMEVYASSLFNPRWGEQIRFSPGRRMSVSMLSSGLDRAAMQADWAPILTWLRERGDSYALAAEPTIMEVPGRRLWDPEFLRSLPGIVLADDRPGAPDGNIFWANNLSETGQTLRAYQSAWLPSALLESDRRVSLVDALVAGSAEWGMALHTNKGLGGGSAEAIAQAGETATNPAMLDAFALLICAADSPPSWPGIPGHEPDREEARREARQVERAMAPIRALVPRAGAYMSEADYFQEGWQHAYWGRHYPRLLEIKRRYDPGNLFTGHHVVGS